MYITKVELDNIKSYEKAAFVFDKGTTAITGMNGAGKSTILEAIAWALFDFLEYSNKDFVRRGAKRGSVRVTFVSSTDNSTYTVYRDTGTGYNVYSHADRGRIAEQKTNVSLTLQRLFGVAPGTDIKSLFESAIGVPQGLFTAAFLLTDEQRKRVFDKLLKVEEYRTSAAKLADTKKLIETRVNDTRARIAHAEGQLAQYDTLVNEQSRQTDALDAWQKQADALATEITTRAAVVQQMDAAEAADNVARMRLERAIGEHAAASHQQTAATTERDTAQAAHDRQQVLSADHLAHLAADEKLRELEHQRTARDVAQNSYTRTQRQLDAVRHRQTQTSDALARARAAAVQADALAADVARQDTLENERDRLRDARARAKTEEARLARLQKSLDALRHDYAEFNAKIKEAEKNAPVAGLWEKLTSERLDADTALSRAEKAAAQRELLTPQLSALNREVARLRREQTTLTQDVTRLTPLAESAGEADNLTARAAELQAQLAQLNAERARDEQFHKQVRDGLCPILSQRCLNIPANQTLEDYFVGQFAANQSQHAALAESFRTAENAARRARAAVPEAAKLAGVHRQLLQTQGLLELRTPEADAVQRQLDALPVMRREDLSALQNRVVTLDAELAAQRNAALRHAELNPLRQRRAELQEEGKVKRAEFDEVKRIVDALPELSKNIATAERELRALQDPRGRVAVLRVEAARAEQLSATLATLEQELADAANAHEQAAQELAQFAELDATLDAARQAYQRTRPAHHEFLRLTATAEMLPARNAAVEAAAVSVAQVAQELATARAAQTEAARLYQREQHAQERLALAQAQQKSAAVHAQLTAVQRRLTELAAELERLSEVRRQLQTELANRERLQKTLEATDFIRQTLKDAGPRVAQVYAYSVGVEANQLYREITGDAARTLEWTKDYQILLEEDGHKRPFLNLSGGEQMVAALAIRLALLKQLSDVRMAFFDEPTVNMDTERRTRLAQQIAQIQDFDQIFVITHDDTFAESADSSVRVPHDGAVAKAASLL